jgi:hypothetical protein
LAVTVTPKTLQHFSMLPEDRCNVSAGAMQAPGAADPDLLRASTIADLQSSAVNSWSAATAMSYASKTPARGSF